MFGQKGLNSLRPARRCVPAVRLVARQIETVQPLLASSEHADTDYPEMVWISGGTLRMGLDHHYAKEAPAHGGLARADRACNG